MSMLVLHPNTSTSTADTGAGTVTVAVGVSVGVWIGVLVITLKGVFVTTVEVATAGVAVLAPITTGVGETMDGVLVGGRKGVGGLYGEF
jgi:hypothetical protein